MAAACSYPLYSTPQSWDTGDRRSFTRGSNAVLASHSTRNSNTSRSISDQLRHRPHHHLQPSRRSREMDEVPALGHVVQDKIRQNKPSEGSKPGTFGMLARRGEPAPILKRSFSTPAVHTMLQESAATAGEKKRNKLGYHRTSIACSHCRRRKIRCIVSANIQNRCENCIRLKKDCSFCPVDQQPTGDSQGSIGGQGTGSSTAHSQSSSPALPPGNPSGIVPGSMYSTGSAQDPPGLAAPVIMPSSVGYASVTGEEIGLSMPNHAEQNFSVSPRSSLAWASAEPSPIALPGSMDMSYELGWHSYGSEPAAAESATQSAWMATTEAAQLHNWNCYNNGVVPAAQTRSVSFSNELIGQPRQQFVSAPNNVLYDGRGTNLENSLTAPMNLVPGPGHIPGQVGEPSGSWDPEQHHMLPQQQPGHDNMGFGSWGVLHNNGPPM